MANPECVCGHNGTLITTLSHLQGTDSHPDAWACRRCRHAWRVEPWNHADEHDFFRDARYTQPEHEQVIKASNAALFERFEALGSAAWPHRPRLMVDFGCSYGHCMEYFAAHRWDILGIEISPTAQASLGRRKLPWAGSLEEADLAPGSVHTMVMADCLCYLPDPVSILRSVARVMHPNGVCLIRQPTRGGLVRLLTKLRRLGVSPRRAMSDSLWLDHVHLFSRRSTWAALIRAGFSDVRFLHEKGFRRSPRRGVIHRLFRTVDLITLRRLDLTLAWTVVAKTGRTKSP